MNGPAAPTYHEYAVRRELATTFSCAWVWSAAQASSGAANERSRSIPNGCAELIWHPMREELVVGGPSSAPAETVRTTDLVVGLRFRAGGVRAMSAVPMADLIDRTVPVDAVGGPAWRDAAPAGAGAAATPGAALRLLQAALIHRRLIDADQLDATITRAVANLSSSTRARHAAEAAFCSDRQLRRRFRQVVGVSPKQLQRIGRFQRVLSLLPLAATHSMTLGRIAAAAGYCDQAHLVDDCRRFGGLTPSGLMRELSESCWPHHDHGVSLGSTAPPRPRA